MKNNSFLTFTLHGLLLAVDTNSVREIIWLPELTMLEECPSYVAGVVNMRGKVLPVLDLNIRFGHSLQKYSLSDRVIILDVNGCGVRGEECGIIVNEVLDVINIPGEDIELPPLEGRETEMHPYFVSGVANAEQSIIMMLNLRAMLDSEFEIPPLEIYASEKYSQSDVGYFSPEADPEGREIFRNRAKYLQKASDTEDIHSVMPVVVVTLHNEFLCVELESVREFSKILTITPVPCCPEHITGNMNFRGSVLTVVDIRGLLNMQIGRVSESAKVIVVDTGEFSVGVIVDELLDIINISATDIVPVPSHMKALDDRFVKGAVPYGSRMMTLLGLKEILAWDGLTVNEEI
jgi:purine-binding chemotaxis protein CheW